MGDCVFYFLLGLQLIALLGLAGVFEQGLFSGTGGGENQLRAEVISLRAELSDLKFRMSLLEGRLIALDTPRGTLKYFSCRPC